MTVVDGVLLTTEGETMAAFDDNSYLHWKEKMYAGSHAYDEDSRFFIDALKSQHLEGKMSAREMTFARNVPPVAKDANSGP